MNEENATNKTVRKIHQMVTRVKSDEEVSLEFMKIYDRERMIKESGIKIGREEGHREGMREGRREEAIESARELFANGAPYELVRKSIKSLTDTELREIYEEVNR